MAERIGMDEFVRRWRAGETVVDVREAAEYAAGHVPGAIFAPMSRIGAHLADLPREQDVLVICRSGHRSLAMADLMVAQGIRAFSVDGGTLGFAARNLPLTTGGEP